MSDDLKEALREWWEYDQGRLIERSLERIEQLEANINLKADFIDATINQLEAAEQRGYANAMEAERKLHEDRIEELEAKLAECEARLEKAVGSLTVIDALDPEGFVNGCSQSALIGLVSRMGAIARTTIEEIKGKDT